MASTNTIQVIQNNLRNVIIRVSQISDGTNNETVKIYDATSSGSYGITIPGGQVVYPSIYTSIVALDYDVQDMKISLRWEATADQDVLPLGAAPETFDWRDFGGIRVPAGLAGATGSLKIVTLNPIVGSTYSMIIQLRKRIPQS